MNCQGCGAEFERVSGAGMYKRIMCYICQPIGGDRKQTYRNKHLKKKYGITQHEYTEMFKKQNGKCLICEVDMIHQNGSPMKGSFRNGSSCSIDHCHKTGKVRGLLCFHCNTALGHVFDDIKILDKMKEYLK